MYKFLHIGVPTTQEKEGASYAEGVGVYVTDPAASPFAIEYVRFMPGTIFPEEMQHDIHVAFEVDSIDEHIKNADYVITPKTDAGGMYLSFIRKDGAIIELIEMKK